MQEKINMGFSKSWCERHKEHIDELRKKNREKIYKLMVGEK